MSMNAILLVFALSRDASTHHAHKNGQPVKAWPVERYHVLRDPPPTPLTSAPTRRSFTVLKEPARLPPPDNGLNLHANVMGRGGTVAAIHRRCLYSINPCDVFRG